MFISLCFQFVSRERYRAPVSDSGRDSDSDRYSDRVIVILTVIVINILTVIVIVILTVIVINILTVIVIVIAIVIVIVTVTVM